MPIDRFMKQLGIQKYPSLWKEIFAAATESEEFDEVLNERYIKDLHNEFQIFPKYLDNIIGVAKKINNNVLYKRYFRLLSYIVFNRKNINDNSIEIPYPVTTDEQDMCNLLLLFILLPTIRTTAYDMQKRGFDQKIIVDTFAEYEDCLTGFYDQHGFLGINEGYFKWLLLISDGKLFRIGRLVFELCDDFWAPVKAFQNKNKDIVLLADSVNVHESGFPLDMAGYNDEQNSFLAVISEDKDNYIGHAYNNGIISDARICLPKSEWFMVLKKGDCFINVHIPGSGRLLSDECAVSYKNALQYIAKIYPEYSSSCFACFSWLLDPQLKNLLKPDSNIVAFQERYNKFYYKQATGVDVLERVFKGEQTENYNNLVEKTTLQRLLKRHYTSGKRIYETGGIFCL